MKGSVYWPLLVFYCAIEGWILSFPLFGPILGPFVVPQGADPGVLATTFLFFFAASFAGWGVIFRNYTQNLAKLRIFVMLAVLACALLSFGLLIMPIALWKVGFALFGILGSLPSLVWLTFVSRGLDRKKIGWNLGVTGVFVELIVYVVRMSGQYLAPLPEFLIIQILPFISLFVLIRSPSLFDIKVMSSDRSQTRNERTWSLYLFIFFFPLVGGIMYNVLQPLFLAHHPRILANYGTLPYVLTMPLAGLLADRKTIRPVAFYGLASLGMAYTVLVLSNSGVAAFAGDTLFNIGFAFMDLFVLFALAWYASGRHAMMYIGEGLGVYIFSILVGTWLTELILPHTQGNYKVIYLVAVLILFVSFFVLERVVKRANAMDLPYDSIGEDLELARSVQQNMLPQYGEFPENWDIAYTLEAAREVGGDFFDVIPLGQNSTLFVIGDVMGKGLSAAMLVASVLGQIRSLVESTQSLADVLASINRVLIRDARFSMYVSVGLVLLDRAKASLTYANAGHMPPYILHDKVIRALELPSLPLGTDAEAVYQSAATDFKAGDVLLLYTDGVVEAKNKRKELYGFDQLEAKLSICQGLSAEGVNIAIATDVKTFVGSKPIDDDFTLLLVKAKI